jgi:hypothetical protein
MQSGAWMRYYFGVFKTWEKLFLEIMRVIIFEQTLIGMTEINSQGLILNDKL